MIMVEAIARIEALKPATLKVVAGALTFSGLPKQPPATPAAFVVPLQEIGGANTRANGVAQKVIERFAVILALKAANDMSGATAEGQLQAVRNAVRDRILGWAPSAGHDDIIFQRGDLVAMENGLVWWQDTYQTASHLFR